MISRYVALAKRRTALLLTMFAAIALISATLGARIEIRTDLADLLPDDHPAVVALRQVAARQRSGSNLVVLVHSADREAAVRFAAAVRERVAGLVPSHFAELQWRPDSELGDFFDRNKWLYADLGDLEQASKLVKRMIARQASPLASDLEGDPTERLRALRVRLDKQLPPARARGAIRGRGARRTLGGSRSMEARRGDRGGG